jgi:signal peptidase complex subunit 3
VYTSHTNFTRQKGRLRRWGAKEEELGSLRFDLRTDLNPLLNSFNTKQLFIYLTAAYIDDIGTAAHEVVLWDRIVTRGDMRDFRAVGKKLPRGGKKGRGKIRIDEGKNTYPWRGVAGTFK